MNKFENEKEDDSDLEDAANIHRLPIARRSSIRILEDQAWQVHEDHTRSISGRLGGRFDSGRGLAEILMARDEGVRRATEESRLLGGMKERTPKSPPLTVWILPALLCASAYAFYNIFIKKGSASINPILGGVVLQFVAATLGSCLLGLIVFSNKTNSPSGGANPENDIHYDKWGLTWSVCAGLAVGSAEMLSFFVSSLGVQASHFIPIIIGGSVMFGAVLGMLVLGEKMMLHGRSGILLLVTGIGLVATDPGDKVEEEAGDMVTTGPPPLVVWIAPALLCASMYALYNIFIKKGSASINPILGGVILQFVAAAFGSLLLGGVMVDEGGAGMLKVSGTGIFWASCAGIAVGTAEMLSFFVSGLGVDASKSIPVIIGGSVIFGAVLGLLVLGETLMLQGWCGVALLMTGIGLVATDPGEKVAGH